MIAGRATDSSGTDPTGTTKLYSSNYAPVTFGATREAQTKVTPSELFLYQTQNNNIIRVLKLGITSGYLQFRTEHATENTISAFANFEDNFSYFTSDNNFYNYTFVSSRVRKNYEKKITGISEPKLCYINKWVALLFGKDGSNNRVIKKIYEGNENNNAVLKVEDYTLSITNIVHVLSSTAGCLVLNKGPSRLSLTVISSGFNNVISNYVAETNIYASGDFDESKFFSSVQDNMIFIAYDYQVELIPQIDPNFSLGATPQGMTGITVPKSVPATLGSITKQGLLVGFAFINGAHEEIDVIQVTNHDTGTDMKLNFNPSRVDRLIIRCQLETAKKDGESYEFNVLSVESVYPNFGKNSPFKVKLNFEKAKVENSSGDKRKIFVGFMLLAMVIVNLF